MASPPTTYGLQLEIYDLPGNLVHTQTINSKQETVSTRLPGGIYFYRIKNKGTIVDTGKLAIQ